MTEYTQITKQERKKSILLIVCFTLVLVVSLPLLFTNYWYVWMAMLITGVSLLMIVIGKGETKKVYKCPKCSHEFTLSLFTTLFAMHGVTKKENTWCEWKYVECPLCHEKSRMIPLSEVGTSHHKQNGSENT